MFATDQVAVVATALQTSKFRFVRLPFLWSEIEPEPGRFVWERSDLIVDELTTREIEILAVLRGTPVWALPEQAATAVDAPPSDPAQYAAFAAAFVERYGDRIDFVQVWDLPNRPERWGGVPATSAAYVALLTSASVAVEAVDPDVRIVLAEFDPRPGGEELGDLEFLRDIYAADAAPFFDIVAATVDGGGRSPYDRRVDPNRANLSRAILVRELMEEVGDAGTPVWGTRYGWRVGDPPEGVTPEQQAEMTLAGLDRAREEWPWLGLLFTWSFIAGEAEPAAAYALLTPAGVATATFSALATFGGTPAATTAGLGYAPTGARSLTFGGRWQAQDLPPRVFQTTNEVGAAVTIRFEGTGLVAYLRRSPNAGRIDATIDGDPLVVGTDGSLASFRADDVPLVLVSGLEDRRHELVLTLAEEGELTFGGLVVTRELPFLWPVALLAAGGAVLLFLALWRATGVVAERSGLLRRRRGDDLWLTVPELPRVSTLRRA